MKITRERPGKVMQEPPRKLSFYNSEGEVVVNIFISEHLKSMSIHPYGASVTVFEYDDPLRKGAHYDSKWVTTNEWDKELVFPQ